MWHYFPLTSMETENISRKREVTLRNMKISHVLFTYKGRKQHPAGLDVNYVLRISYKSAQRFKKTLDCVNSRIHMKEDDKSSPLSRLVFFPLALHDYGS